MPPRVSVLLPARNAGHTLPAALDSLLGQTLADLEIIVADDGSTDDTPAVLAAYARRDDRVRPFRLPGLGVAPALNACLARAQAPLVARMDADDLSHPDRLRRQADWLDARPDLALAACLAEYGGDRAANLGYALYVDWINSLRGPETVAAARFIESPFAHPTVMLRRAVLERRGAYREGDFPEDYELWLRLLHAGERLDRLPETLFTWNDPPGRLSRVHPNYRPDAFYRLKAEWLARWLAERNPRHPDVYVIGAGRISRLRAELLVARGVSIKAYVDIDPKKIGRAYAGRPTLPRSGLPGPGRCFALSYVGSRGAREEIRAWLVGEGYVEGVDFLLAA